MKCPLIREDLKLISSTAVSGVATVSGFLLG